MLQARATGALIGLFGLGAFAVIAWYVAGTGQRVWLVAALISTVAAPFAYWAFDHIRADLRSGRVVPVTGPAIIMSESEDEDDHWLWVDHRGRRIRVPFAAGGIVRQGGDVTAFYTQFSRMLVNLAPAVPDDKPA